MPEKAETLPPVAAINAVRDSVVAELVNRASAEVGCSLQASVLIYQDGRTVMEAGTVQSNKQTTSQPVCGEIRIRFRSTGSTNRYLFFIDSLFAKDVRAPDFSGFMARGAVTEKSLGEYLAQYSAWVVKRFDNSWSRWM